MVNPWCQHCCCPANKKPCQKEKSPFTFEEITEAISKQDFEPIRNEFWGYDNTRNTHGLKNEDLCNRARHVRRIAYLAVNCDGRDPIRMKPDKDEIDDGGHRLAAAIYRGADVILARVRADFDVEAFKGHLASQ
ncbi:MAG TPA: hypothetical protein VFQ43_01765 [Nitrososphaera sp.]|nr:hypothetical protein [Nitrososphaera sp.]